MVAAGQGPLESPLTHHLHAVGLASMAKMPCQIQIQYTRQWLLISSGENILGLLRVTGYRLLFIEPDYSTTTT